MADEIRSCAGGIVFRDGKVFLLRTPDGEWSMPKGVIREHNPSNTVALWRVEDEAGIHAEIIGIAGNTSHEFFSESRGKYVTNRIQWFCMRAADGAFRVNSEQGFTDGGYFSVDEAAGLLTREKEAERVKKAAAIYEKMAR